MKNKIACSILLSFLLIISTLFIGCESDDQGGSGMAGAENGAVIISASESGAESLAENVTGESITVESVSSEENPNPETAGADGQAGETEKQANGTNEQNAGAGQQNTGNKDENSEIDEKAASILADMTLEEKVLQMFFISPEALICGKADTVTKAGNLVQTYLEKYPVGGIVFTKSNLKNTDQTTKMLEGFQEDAADSCKIPLFLSVTEEGGTVTRIAQNTSFGVNDVGNMCDIDTSEDAEEAGEYIGSYMKNLGFNLDFAPVADVLTNSKNTVVAKRSFGSDPEDAAEKTIAFLDGLHESGMLGTLKHFPGHGSTAEDSHKGAAVSKQTMEELKSEDLVPFQEAIDADAQIIMVGHISLPNVTGDNTPATLSEAIVTDLLRDEMGFDGIVITDSMNMGAISDNYKSGTAAVKAIQAGVDMILTPEDFVSAYKAVLDAVDDGTITEERIDESVRRILAVKIRIAD